MATALVEHALSLIASEAIESPECARRLRAELEAWRTLSADHEAAYAQALQQWHALGSVAPQLKSRFAEPSRVARRRKSGTGTLAAIAFVFLGLSALWTWHSAQPVFERTLATGTAELARLPLPDGSRIDLSARTRLRIVLYRDRRVVELEGGEARFEVVADRERPFQVVTRQGSVEVVGTAFAVSDREQLLTIEIEHGRVRFLLPRDPAGILLDGGERLVVRGGVPGAVERVGAREFAAWREGWLVFDNEPLSDALPAINAFRPVPIRLGDDRAGALRLTGRFRAGDTRALLSALPRILPVQIIEQSGESVEIRSR